MYGIPFNLSYLNPFPKFLSANTNITVCMELALYFKPSSLLFTFWNELLKSLLLCWVFADRDTFDCIVDWRLWYVLVVPLIYCNINKSLW